MGSGYSATCKEQWLWTLVVIQCVQDPYCPVRMTEMVGNLI